ncbi:hypothetical protein IA54_021350 [Xanthomonas phaseoli pv. syngonii LMG 9055]|uniref:Uncharacterized protein n=1 Tax=Xanthomonas phaseoli pv. syngonii LMG 9055 TaxID=1437878 RepID=A0A1V9HEM6_9XANT|nr:hypothetical protein IA54_021350 [Xanthomonas phaseoli pv. syngonii LMG 9055]
MLQIRTTGLSRSVKSEVVCKASLPVYAARLMLQPAWTSIARGPRPLPAGTLRVGHAKAPAECQYALAASEPAHVRQHT